MAGEGLSKQTKQELMTNPDLDKGLVKVGGAVAQRLNMERGQQKSFNERTMTQAERDAELKRQKEKTDAAYQAYKQRGKI